MTLDEIHAAGGPHQNVVGRISRFDPATMKPWRIRRATFTALDKALADGVPTAYELYRKPATEPPAAPTVDELANAVAGRVVGELLAMLERLVVSADRT